MEDRHQAVRTLARDFGEPSDATTLGRERRRSKSRRWRWAVAILFALPILAWAAFQGLDWAFPFPIEHLRGRPQSAVVTDRSGDVILAHVADDDQWRLPVPLTEMSPWLQRATVAVEDERFREHGGVDATAVLRAASQNLAAGRIVSGASTLTMQLCHMIEPRLRGWRTKAIVSFRACQLERLWGKDQILEAYLNEAPYGGNLRGVEAAAQYYFGRSAADLTIAEAALLAGVPQSPNRLRPDRFPAAAKNRRATVLRRMHEVGAITAAERARANAEPVCIATGRNWNDRRGSANHFGWLALARRPQGGCTTLSAPAQRAVELACQPHARELPTGSDHAVVVIEIEHGDVVALVGSAWLDDPVDGQVNGAIARRSPGSTLKPFIYAAAFATGRLTPTSQIPDGPLERGGWRPENFDGGYRLEVTAAEALRASLNVPAIRVAEKVGLGHCVGTLQAVGLPLRSETATRSGLALATGAVEVTLLDLTNAYATLGRRGVAQPVRLFVDEEPGRRRAIDAAACDQVEEILSYGQEAGDRRRGGRSRYMMKTGTSSGYRDAWAVGHNGRYAIGVWVGCFPGPGHTDYVGAAAAAPLLEALFDLPEFAGLARARTGGEDPRRSTGDRDANLPATSLALERAPFRFECHAGPALRIVEPRDGVVILARGVSTAVELATDTPVSGTWFVDGVVVPGQPTRTHLAPGTHVVRFVSSGGESAASRVVIQRGRSFGAR